jgi:hypothetical protein
MVVRRRFELDAELEALKELADDERRRALEGPLLDLTPEQDRELQEFQALSLKEAQSRHKELSKEVSMQLTLLGIRERASAPYWFSDLSKWLGFETWKPKDALLLLSGVSPTAAIVDWTFENFMGGRRRVRGSRAAPPRDVELPVIRVELLLASAFFVSHRPRRVSRSLVVQNSDSS